MLKPTIPFSDFTKLDLRVGLIKNAEEIAQSDKLVRMTVDLGEEVGTRRILAGVKQFFTTKDLTGKLIVVLVNLEYRKMMGEESQGMLLAADVEGKPILLKPSKKVKPGTIIK